MRATLGMGITAGLLTLTVAGAQKTETQGIYTYTVPAGWKKEVTGNGTVRFSRQQGGLYCLFDLMQPISRSGTLDANFQQDWQDLVVKPFRPAEAPTTEPGTPKNGWQNKLGAAPFEYEGGTSLALLVTLLREGQVASVLLLTNDQKCPDEFEAFVGQLTLKAPSAARPAAPAVNTPATPTGILNIQPFKTGFAFNTTTFDDGWISVEQKDWVLARKGNLVVRLHYPNDALKGILDSDKLLSAAWNTLVAPRYRSLEGYKQDFNSLDYFRPHLAAGTATSTETGQRAYVTLFQRDASGWIEIVTPDRPTFVQAFGVDVDSVDKVDFEVWKKLQNLRGLNRFAVAASDLKGTWTYSSSGMTQWVNAVTGLSAGATSASYTASFTFGPNSTYTYNWGGASGVVGALNFSSGKSNGKFSLKGNWQVNFSDISGGPRLYNAFFEAGRGVRVLWMQNTSSPGSGADPYLRTK